MTNVASSVLSHTVMSGIIQCQIQKMKKISVGGGAWSGDAVTLWAVPGRASFYSAWSVTEFIDCRLECTKL